jgi:hypothetical protein
LWRPEPSAALTSRAPPARRIRANYEALPRQPFFERSALLWGGIGLAAAKFRQLGAPVASIPVRIAHVAQFNELGARRRRQTNGAPCLTYANGDGG